MKKHLLIILLLSALGGLSVNAQCTSSQGANSGSVFVNDDIFNGLPWSQPQNAQSSDNSYASVGLSPFGPYSSYLQATGFGFSIPTTASICGIELNVERSFSGSIPVQDYFIHVVKNNTVTGLDYASNLDWDTTDLVVTYGSNSDLWGTTWTPAEINNSSFGAAVSASKGGPFSSTALVDQITIKVFYDNSTGIADNTAGNDAIRIFPNPSSGNFTITFPDITNNGSIEIYSALGERILSQPVSLTSKKEINIKNISRGIYFVKVYDGEEYFCKKIIVEQN